MSEGEKASFQPQSGEYHGIDFFRGAWEYESVLWRCGIKGLIGEIEIAAKRAAREKRKEITVLDLGSSSNSLPARTLVKDCLNHPEELPKDSSPNVFYSDEHLTSWPPQLGTMYDVLEKYDCKLHYLGLTDAEDQKQHGEVLWSHDDDRYFAQNVGYTITRNQTVAKATEKYLSPAEPIDLAIAMNFFLYITPQSFEQIVTDVVGRLTPGGKLVAVDFKPRYFIGRNDSLDRFGRPPKAGVYKDALPRRVRFLTHLRGTKVKFFEDNKYSHSQVKASNFEDMENFQLVELGPNPLRNFFVR